MPTKTADPDLALTEQQIAAIVTTAQDEAEQAARAVDQAEATARGEAPSAGLAMKAANITPAALLELRAAAELAAMGVHAAEKRTEEVRGKQLLAYQAAAAAQVREHAAAALDGAEHIIAALDAFETALTGLCDVVQAHNDRVTHWTERMGAAGPLKGEWVLSDGITVDGRKAFRPLTAGNLLGAAIFRAMQAYPLGFDAYDGRPLAGRDWFEGIHAEPVDARARIRRDA